MPFKSFNQIRVGEYVTDLTVDNVFGTGVVVYKDEELIKIHRIFAICGENDKRETVIVEGKEVPCVPARARYMTGFEEIVFFKDHSRLFNTRT